MGEYAGNWYHIFLVFNGMIKLLELSYYHRHQNIQALAVL